jgi:hypothetical protein
MTVDLKQANAGFDLLIELIRPWYHFSKQMQNLCLNLLIKTKIAC